VQCTARGTSLYLLVPDTSDHLFNLEIEPEVAVTGESWGLRGTVDIIQNSPDLFPANQSQWHTVVRVTPIRLHIQAGSSMANYAETIDFDDEQSF
jgi:hypothetical protein